VADAQDGVLAECLGHGEGGALGHVEDEKALLAPAAVERPALVRQPSQAGVVEVPRHAAVSPQVHGMRRRARARVPGGDEDAGRGAVPVEQCVDGGGPPAEPHADALAACQQVADQHVVGRRGIGGGEAAPALARRVHRGHTPALPHPGAGERSGLMGDST